jgi:DNA-binding NtrC family response regulator
MPTPPPDTTLIIDDNTAVRQLLDIVLTGQGNPVLTAATVSEAEEAKRHLGPRGIALVIADIRLSDDGQAQEGLGRGEHWSATDPLLPFLLISGQVTQRTLPAVHGERRRFLPKPFLVQELLENVRTLLRPVALEGCSRCG